jgi:arabinan endo-1,5-alpha-L-arabinosidase
MKLCSFCLVSTILLGSLPAIARADDSNPASRAGLPLEQTASRGIITRDPSTIVKCKDEFWVFYTGRGIPSFHSKDLVKWEPGPPVFQAAPEWTATAVPANRNMGYWAPDVIHLGNRYLLYYSVSSMGKMTSAIGLATTPTLDPADPAYHWTDQGIVVQSKEGGDFNTIDPAVFSDDDGTLWLAFGSYWSGIKLTQLDPKTGKRLHLEAAFTSLAYNKSIEASFLYKHDGYYYLFVNWDSCCRGMESTYNIRVGRSRKITGPYVDKDGIDMLKSGGTLLLGNKGPLAGPGHAGILRDSGKTWFTSDFEGDSRMGGKATLAIMPLKWESGWPVVEVVDK